MKKTIFLFLFTLVSLFSISQEVDIKGVLMFYYSGHSPKHWNQATVETMFCLDSIRLIEKKKISPILGDLVQHEHFLYESNLHKRVYIYTKVLRDEKFYCLNPFENYLHKGGEIFNCNDSLKLIIGFNIEGVAFSIFPNINSIKNDSLNQILKRNLESFKESEQECPCVDFVNNEPYLIIKNITRSSVLNQKQIRKFGLKKSSKTEFLRYGNW